MKKKIAILGSTGSIGKCLINIIKKDKRNFEIILLSADETKSPGPFDETCRFSISPKSLIRDLEAFMHALDIKFI